MSAVTGVRPLCVAHALGHAGGAVCGVGAGGGRLVAERATELATLLPPPSAIAKAAVEMIASGELLMHLWQSLKRELIAFLFALFAVPLGIAMGWWRWVHEQIDPIVEILRPIPPIAWIPLSILWLGIGNAQNQFIIFLGIFFPLLINTIQGVKTWNRTSCARRAAWARASGKFSSASLLPRRYRKSSLASASASALAGWRWWLRSWSAPVRASAF